MEKRASIARFFWRRNRASLRVSASSIAARTPPRRGPELMMSFHDVGAITNGHDTHRRAGWWYVTPLRAISTPDSEVT